MPDSVVRNMAKFVAQADGWKRDLQLKTEANLVLGRIIINKDSIISNKDKILFDETDKTKATQVLLDVCKAQKSDLEKKYSRLKVNDRLKMGFCATVIVGIVYAYIQKK